MSKTLKSKHHQNTNIWFNERLNNHMTPLKIISKEFTTNKGRTLTTSIRLGEWRPTTIDGKGITIQKNLYFLFYFEIFFIKNIYKFCYKKIIKNYYYFF